MISLSLVSVMMVEMVMSSIFVVVICFLLKCVMRWLVMKFGVNIVSRCYWILSVVLLIEWLVLIIVIGVVVMMKVMRL